MDLKFRLLRADEIDARVSQITARSVMLLLYKDARCDMNILDETVGPLNWQRKHSRDNANCVASIWDEGKGRWVEKEDTGTESNTEAEKGLASDSFKRACVNWGIGRELYTTPSLFFPIDKTRAEKGNDKRMRCYDKFVVDDIEYKDRSIAYVKLRDVNTQSVMEVGRKQGQTASAAKSAPVTQEKAPNSAPDKMDGEEPKKALLAKIRAISDDADVCNNCYKWIMGKLGVKAMSQMTADHFDTAFGLVDVYVSEMKKEDAAS